MSVLVRTLLLKEQYARARALQAISDTRSHLDALQLAAMGDGLGDSCCNGARTIAEAYAAVERLKAIRGALATTPPQDKESER